MFYFGTLFIYSLVLVSILFLFILCGFQIKFITSNETTSENLRKTGRQKNPFDLGWQKNISQFWNDILGYEKDIKYTESARKLLQSECFLSDYFSDLLSDNLRNSVNMSMELSKTSANHSFVEESSNSSFSEKV
jgi:hypothetical protein